jgi:chromosome segregation ATPase
LFDRDPVQVIEYASAFLSVMEFYLPSPEEQELAKSELTRLERLGEELNRAGNELKEEVKREFASLKAQVETEVSRLEAENARLQLSENILTSVAAQLKAELTDALDELARLRPYADPRLYNAALRIWTLWAKPAGYEALEKAMSNLAEAVTWWNALPAAEAEVAGEVEGVTE